MLTFIRAEKNRRSKGFMRDEGFKLLISAVTGT